MSLEILFDRVKLKEELQNLEAKTLEKDFYKDKNKSEEIFDRIKFIKQKLESYESLVYDLGELEAYEDLIDFDPSDGSVLREAEKYLNKAEARIDNFKISTLLQGEFDKLNAYMSIHSGAGGLEAQDWADMLKRMYLRWLQKSDFKCEVLEENRDSAGGIKSCYLKIIGENAYGYLKSEKGVHRLVRISPFDTSNRRHTSFASVDVFPEIKGKEVSINKDDLKIDTYRSSGKGGQGVNTTDSAVRITHLPTGIVVSCQNERSQLFNKETALSMLYGKLKLIKEEENKEKIEDITGSYTDIGFGQQIRSYIFQPYQLVKDHRTNFEVGDVESVMDGDIEKFIIEYLKQN